MLLGLGRPGLTVLAVLFVLASGEDEEVFCCNVPAGQSILEPSKSGVAVVVGICNTDVAAIF